MRTFFLYLSVFVFLSSVYAVDYSAGTKLYLRQSHKHHQKVKSGVEQKNMSCFLHADAPAVAKLRGRGVKVVQLSDSLATADIPIGLLNNNSITGLKRISVAKKLQLCNDSAQIMSFWTAGFVPELYSKYTGKGVIVGMIDTGFDIQHVNFKTTDGKRRISAVYFPTDSLGMAPIIGTDTLPGSCYFGSEIDNLTTDCMHLHGTHTMGTAAGSYIGNKYFGIAQDAELVVCGMDESELSDVNIANSLKFILDYAERKGKPCVVNMSLSSYSEAHDGSSDLCKLFEDLSGNGKIIVVSSGNDGNKDVCLHKSLAAPNDTLTTFLANQYYGYNLNGHLSMWGDSDNPFSMRVQILDRQSKAILYESPWLSAMPQDSVYDISSESDAEFAKHYNGEWLFASAVESNGKFHSDFVVDAKYKDVNHVMRLQFVSSSSVNLRGWGSANMRFVDYGFSGCTRGDASMSISDLATSDSVISVGAYCSRRFPAVISGVNADVVKGSVPFDIAPFSSYGADMRGISHPDVVAPGQAVVSSYSRFDQSMAKSNNWLTCVETVDGVDYPYGINSGTSMSAPVVTGALALALQANSNLSVHDIKVLLYESSVRDSFVESDPARWGSGKLNIQSILSILDKKHIAYDINDDGEVNVTDVTALINHILGVVKYLHTDVNGDGVTNVSDVTSLISYILSLL